MTQASVPLQRAPFGQTQRRDSWWVEPLLVFLGLASFLVYATWAAFQGTNYASGPYLSPFYSPELFGASIHSWFGPKPGWWPGWLPFSPALLILPIPAGFRVTCYYYRGAYYKAFVADPISCAVGEPQRRYCGEQSFPLILQNIHRYFLYLALFFLSFLAADVWRAMWFADAQGTEHFGMGVGTLVLAINVMLLGGYTLSCHSLRHLVGGCHDKLSASRVRLKLYGCASSLNRRHMNFAWFSLVWVMFSDLYVRLCAMGIWTDWRLF